VSFALFALRDGLTITSSFVIKNTVKDKLEAEHGYSKNSADLIASFSVPMIAQLFSTPLHILVSPSVRPSGGEAERFFVDDRITADS
jgi:hypothetical protein